MTPDDCPDCGRSDRGVCGEHLAQARDAAGSDHHPPCPGGCGELADECCCPRPNPLGSMRITGPVGSRTERAAGLAS